MIATVTLSHHDLYDLLVGIGLIVLVLCVATVLIVAIVRNTHRR